MFHNVKKAGLQDNCFYEDEGSGIGLDLTKPACVLSHFGHVQLFMTLWTVAFQAPLSMGILQARILEWVAMIS